MRVARIAALVCAFVCTVVARGALPARAGDDVRASVGLSLAPLIGEHVETGDVSHPPPIPIPIGQISLRYKPIELFVESLPGSPAISEGYAGNQTISTRLAFLNAVVRAYDRTNRFWIGGGETVYNQSSDYLSFTRFGATDSVSTSRVVGGRYELGAGLLRKPSVLRLWFDVNPVLQGINNQYLDGFHAIALPERGSQFETQLEIANAHGPFEFDYGVRYVNYSAHYRSGDLADRNLGFLPYATFAYRFGYVQSGR